MFPGVVMINSLYWMIFVIAQILIIAGGYAWLKSANKSVKPWQMAILYGTFASFLLVIGGGFSMNDNSDAKISKFRYIVYVNAPIKIYPRISLIPEIAYSNDTDEVAGKSTDKAALTSGVKLKFMIF